MAVKDPMMIYGGRRGDYVRCFACLLHLR